MTPGPQLPVFPWRLSGVVLANLLADPASLVELGEQIHAAPYKAAPKAPVLGVKPCNTWSGHGASVEVPAAGEAALEVCASLGIVVGRTACRVREQQARQHVAGYLLAADLAVPSASHYRPGVRLRARDGSCFIGSSFVAAAALPDPDALELQVLLDGVPVQTVRNRVMGRSVDRLLADVTEFMTLRPGDLLLLGTGAQAPRGHAGQSFMVRAAGFQPLQGSLVAERSLRAASP